MTNAQSFEARQQAVGDMFGIHGPMARFVLKELQKELTIPKLKTPKPEVFKINDRGEAHTFSAQPIDGSFLVRYPASKYGKAINDILAAEYNMQFNAADHEAEGHYLTKPKKNFLTIAIIDNDHTGLGSPDSIVGFIKPLYQYLHDWEDNTAPMWWPSIEGGPEVSRKADLSDNARILLKAEMINFALRAFDNPNTVVVRPDLRPIDNADLYELLDLPQSPTNYLRYEDKPKIPYYQIQTTEIKRTINMFSKR